MSLLGEHILRGVVGQECESIHKIRISKVTEVSNNVVVRFKYSEIGYLKNSTFHSQLKIKKT